MIDDFAILRRYVNTNDQAAFAEWVRRHLGLVYAAALRSLGGDAHGAEPAEVFVTAARNATRLARHASVTGWLYTTTRNAALNFMRNEQRRRQRERAAADLAQGEFLQGGARCPPTGWFGEFPDSRAFLTKAA